jgi:WD40 repeat protein
MVKETQQFDCGMASANCAVLDPAAELVYIGSEDSQIKVYNAHTGEKETELKGHEDAVNQLLVDSSKDSYLFSASSDCTFRIWQ